MKNLTIQDRDALNKVAKTIAPINKISDDDLLILLQEDLHLTYSLLFITDIKDYSRINDFINSKIIISEKQKKEFEKLEEYAQYRYCQFEYLDIYQMWCKNYKVV